MIDFKKAFTPKDVEEIRPGLFIQARPKNPDTIEYKQVHPLYWNGHWKLKGQISWSNILMIFLIVALFFQGVKFVNFYEEVNADPVGFCQNVSLIDLGNIQFNYENTGAIQTNPQARQWELP